MATYELTVHQLLERLAIDEKKSRPTPPRKDSMDLMTHEEDNKRRFTRTTSVSSNMSDWSESETDFADYHQSACRAFESKLGAKIGHR
ncbi:hypothetical protein Slin15195_G043920 [Septoria linicola]|uniref:Uncharacterized protein n=1 Tax=Septoria linicola TaxID=215465 RepID=A0A9Q9ARZ6_9PEZI|nr:hypothetical protein Slin15195_G043920 [Septoria linicola]